MLAYKQTRGLCLMVHACELQKKRKKISGQIQNEKNMLWAHTPFMPKENSEKSIKKMQQNSWCGVMKAFFFLLLTAVALWINHGNVIEFGLFDALYGSWAPRQGAMCQERAVYMASAITTGRRAINTIEFHCCSGGNSCFMLLNGSPIFEYTHLIAIRYRAARCTN